MAAVPEPSQLQILARLSESRITMSEEVGQIGSADAQAVITALVIQSQHDDPDRARGIRIDLRNESWTDQVFVDEDELVYLKHDLDSMDRWIDR